MVGSAGNRLWKMGKVQLSPLAFESHCCGRQRGNGGMAVATGLQSKANGCVLPLWSMGRKLLEAGFTI